MNSRIAIIGEEHMLIGTSALAGLAKVIEDSRAEGVAVVVVDSITAVSERVLPLLHEMIDDKMADDVPIASENPRENFRKFIEHKNHKRR